MTEQIGNVTLNLKHYPGQDFYSDGAVEEELLEIARTVPESEFPRVIEERASWPVLYHLSPLRENIVEWVPLEKDMKVLEVGAGCGAITGALSRKAGHVDCIDLSKLRSLINAHRHKDCQNITIHVGNFQDIEKELPCDYDYIFLIGVFEYAQGYIGTDRPYERFMEILKRHLKQDGRLVIAIENKFGLKYWAGCREDHQGLYFSGIEDYPQDTGVRTFTRGGLEKICRSCGCEEYSFYYPYPDYKFMTSIYSDAYLPKIGELTANIRNFDRSRMLLFDEKNAFDTIIKEGLFPLFSNSYFLVAGRELPVKYARYSNDRAPQFAVRTQIRTQDGGREFAVDKIGLNSDAVKHVKGIREKGELLKKRYEGSRLSINRCDETEQGLTFEFVHGCTLEEVFDEYLDRGDDEGFAALFREYMEVLAYREEAGVTDFDLIFSNIIVGADTWTAIDYEWTFRERVPVKEMAYRALARYLEGGERRKRIRDKIVREVIGLSGEEEERAGKREAQFQEGIAGERKSIGLIRNLIGNPVWRPYELLEAAENGPADSVQIYEDTGAGFSEAESFRLSQRREEIKKTDDLGAGHISFEVRLRGKHAAVRIDPETRPCLTVIGEAFWNGEKLPLKGKRFRTNGRTVSDGLLVFETDDPGFTFLLEGMAQKEENLLSVSMDVLLLPKETAGKIACRRAQIGTIRF